MKKFLSFILVFVLCFVLVGCTGGSQGGTQGGQIGDAEIPTELTKDPIEVEFWHAMGTANQTLIAKIIANFEAEYAAQGYNIKVTQQSLGDYTALRDAVTSNIAAGTQPTIAQTYPDHVALYIAGNAMQELDSYNESKWGLGAEESQYIDGFYAEGKIYDSANTLYSLPFNKSTEVLYYNKTIFEKYGWSVPKTWDEVVAISAKFAETSEYRTLVNAGKDVAGFSYDSEANLFITFTQQWGGEYTGYENTTGTGTAVPSGKGYILFDNAKSKEAIKFYYDNYQKGYMVTTTYFGTNYSSDAFKAGQCIMTLGSSAGASYNVPSDGSFEVGVAAYPQKDLSNPQVIQQGTNVSLFKCTDPQEELAGWLFLKYLTNQASAKIWVMGYADYDDAGNVIDSAVGTSYFPIRKDVLNSAEYADYISGKDVAADGSVTYSPTTQQLAAKVGLEQQDWFFTNVAFDGSSAARDRAEALVQTLFYDDHGTKDINDVINEVYEEAIDRIIYG